MGVSLFYLGVESEHPPFAAVLQYDFNTRFSCGSRGTCSLESFVRTEMAGGMEGFFCLFSK
ncbi:MAG: hypothetical protein C6P37_15570 [Caldibacillus debilis]|uniref:Uncharacterized protein n=1 Tax=Caldibacillus debilis TaxID=301148 RepID=A0A3E0JXJ7_9BACI|nr:MAG: hypothetical protein C6P37_15570 [Caldibacillus debilis]